MLESHMACLRLAFENWVDNEPNEPEESAPTEEQIQVFEEAEKTHQEMYYQLEKIAQALSLTLGKFGKLFNDSLKRSILGFMKEGIRFSFDGAGSQEDDDLVVGSRLAFLLILSKYVPFIECSFFLRISCRICP